jgi:hypothetical protein
MIPSPKILMVSPIPSHPADQGNSARILKLGQELKDLGVHVEFYYYGMEGLTDDQRRQMSDFWHGFHFMPSLPLPEPSWPRYWGIDDWCPPSLCDAVRSIVERGGFRAVMVNYVWMSRVFCGLENVIKILDTHDLFGDRHKVAIDAGLEPNWFFTSLDEERGGLERADLVIAIQSAEASILRERCRSQVVTVGHCPPPEYLVASRRRKPIELFGYIGSANPWNIKSILEFDKAYSQNASAGWLLAGSITRQTMKLRSQPSLLGMVEKLEDFYDSVDCVINPMLGGTGLKIKTVEALSFGKPVIGTLDAFQGIPSNYPAHQATTMEDFVRIVHRYSSNMLFRKELRRATVLAYWRYHVITRAQIQRLHRYLQ